MMASALPEVLARARVKQQSSPWASGLVLGSDEGRDKAVVTSSGGREEEHGDVGRGAGGGGTGGEESEGVGWARKPFIFF